MKVLPSTLIKALLNLCDNALIKVIVVLISLRRTREARGALVLARKISQRPNVNFVIGYKRAKFAILTYNETVEISFLSAQIKVVKESGF